MTGSSRSLFGLSGPSISLDDRVHAVRGDLADLALAGQIFVPHYARPMAMTCTLPTVTVQRTPGPEGDPTSQLLLGEDFMVIDFTGGWAWGYCRHDHYVGYVPESALGPDVEGDAGAVISVCEAQLFVVPDKDSARNGALPMGARARGARTGDFIETPLGFVAIEAVDPVFADSAAVATALIDTPYLWGGRSGDGIDCSGLVQQALALTGVAAPRDSDQQMDALGDDIATGDALKRNDLVFFPGHVGIMADETTLLHATRHWGKVVCEPLADVVARVAEKHEIPVIARKRLAP